MLELRPKSQLSSQEVLFPTCISPSRESQSSAIFKRSYAIHKIQKRKSQIVK